MAFSFRTVLMAAGFMALGATTTLALDASARGGGQGMHQRGPGHHGPRVPGAGLARAMGQLDLTADQQAALESIRDDVMADMKAMHAERKAEKGDIVEQLATGELSRDQVHSQIDAHAAERTEMAHEVVDRIMDVYETLSPEQRAELVTVIEEHQARRADRMERFEEAMESGEFEGRRGRGGRGGR